jgi:hypothetical protein
MPVGALTHQVHVFEVVIRVLGGLLSAHALLARSPDILGHQVYKVTG